jgi:hypothetical protein
MQPDVPMLAPPTRGLCVCGHPFAGHEDNIGRCLQVIQPTETPCPCEGARLRSQPGAQ